jgi:hypothetical protein
LVVWRWCCSWPCPLTGMWPYVSLSTIWPSWARNVRLLFSDCLGDWPSTLCGSIGFCNKLTLLWS